MEIASDTGLEFIDLKLKIVEGKIRVDLFAKPNNGFSCTTPNTCCPKKNIWNILKGIILRLRRICNDDVTFDKRSLKYQDYVIAREHKPYTVQRQQQFSEFRNKRRAEAKKKHEKQGEPSDVKFLPPIIQHCLTSTK